MVSSKKLNKNETVFISPQAKIGFPNSQACLLLKLVVHEKQRVISSDQRLLVLSCTKQLTTAHQD